MRMPPSHGVGDPPRLARASAQSAIQTHTAFGNHKRSPRHDPFVKRFVETPTIVIQNSSPHLDACSLQLTDRSAAVPGIHIKCSDHNGSHTGVDKRARASCRAPARRARLERHIQSCLRRYATAKISQARNFGMRGSGTTMVSLCDDAIAPDEHRAHGRIWARAPERFLRFAQSRAHETLVLL